MKLINVFPSKYLKAADLQGSEQRATISKCVMEEVGDDTNLVLYFSGKDKGLVCNKTNANRIAHYFTDETDNWVGKTIVMGVELVDYQGKTTEAIRIKGVVHAANDNQAPDAAVATQAA